ncbi:MAG: lysine exporter LysO family protein [Candidatus Limisoma sp.]|nr:lysine exporter LysO family protein [Candidatus Limisoma sp.]
MKTSLIIVGCFVVGMLLPGLLPDASALLHQSTVASEYVLYALLFLVGIGIGSDPELPNIIRSFSPRVLVVPAATIVGTIAFSALTIFLLPHRTLADCLAIGSGMGYYSLSSVLITQLRTPDAGITIAAELGTIALIANIVRELITRLASPALARLFGPLAPICAGGATTADTTFPIITQTVGSRYAFIAIIHGIIVDASVPFLVSLFCSV